MGKENYYVKFEKLSNELLEPMKGKYFEFVDKAKDWKFAHQKFSEAVTNQVNQYNSDLKNFSEVSGNFFSDWDNADKLTIHKDRSQIFNEMIEAIEVSKRDEAILHLSRMNFQFLWLSFWFDQYQQREKIHQYAPKEPENNEHYYNPIYWKGENETEFVQFIYALHGAGYIEHDSKQIKNLVEDFAYFLNFPLGKNWQVNLSTSIHKRNSDYAPLIFNKLDKAYKDFRVKKINKKKNN